MIEKNENFFGVSPAGVLSLLMSAYLFLNDILLQVI